MVDAIIVVAAAAAFAVVGLFFLLYSCHCFLHVLGDSSAGIDEVRWPDESLTDWWWKPLYCVGLFAFWGVTCLIVVGPFFIENPAGFWIAYPLALWLIYPISVGSPFAANNMLMIVDPHFLGRLFHHPRALLTVLVITVPLPAAVVWMIGVLLARGHFGWAVGAALVLPAALLFYARAWGRLAWLVLNDEPFRPKKPRYSAGSPALAVEDPWQTPEPDIPELDVEVLEEDLVEPLADEIEDEWSLHKKPYGLLNEEIAREEWKQRRRAKEPLGEAYDVTQAAPLPLPDESEKYRRLHEIEKDIKAREQGMTRVEWDQEQEPPTFRRALGRGLFAFLFYPPTLHAWLYLGLLTLGELFFVYIIAGLVPYL
jgi:hypothetical protein